MALLQQQPQHPSEALRCAKAADAIGARDLDFHDRPQATPTARRRSTRPRRQSRVGRSAPQHGIEEDYDEQGEQYEALEEVGRVEDADWEMARGDFTKLYNRSRQLATAAGSSGASASGASQTPLPAMNRARRALAPSVSAKRLCLSVSTGHSQLQLSADHAAHDSYKIPFFKLSFLSLEVRLRQQRRIKRSLRQAQTTQLHQRLHKRRPQQKQRKMALCWEAAYASLVLAEAYVP